MTRELSEQAKAMLQRALADERPLVPGAPRRAQLKRRLLQGAALLSAGQAAAAPLGLGASGAATKGAFGVASLGPLAKGLAVGILVSGGLIAGIQVFFGTPGPAEAPVVVARSDDAVPAVAAAPGPLLAPEVATSVTPPRDENPASAVVTSARASSGDVAPPAEAAPGLAAELHLMNAAQTALRDGRSAQALELLQRYDQAFPHGQLLGERLAAEVFAACQVGNRARAIRAAERFLQQDASSVLAGRVRRSCAFAQKGNEP